MSARKTEAVSFDGSCVSSTHCLSLPADAVQFRKNGIEFRSDEPIPRWTEMTLSLQRPGEARKMHCTGVIVDCNGDAAEGYRISMLFTSLSRQSQALLLGYL